MEDGNKKKRVRDESPDSEANTPESKIHRVASNSEVNSSESELTRVDSELNSSESQLTRIDSEESLLNSNDAAFDPAGARGMQDDLLNLLDDPDTEPDRDSAMQGLDSVIKSFEEEILPPGPDLVDPPMGPESGVLQLGYLLEASDDELGLPPTVTPNDEGSTPNEQTVPVCAEGLDLARFPAFEDDIPNYESFGFGNGILVDSGAVDNRGTGGFEMIDGLFDYAESTDILWPSESLQAM